MVSCHRWPPEGRPVASDTLLSQKGGTGAICQECGWSRQTDYLVFVHGPSECQRESG